jgi:hypothetical protein
MTVDSQNEQQAEGGADHSLGEIAFVAIVVYESSSETPDYVPLYDESFLVLKARTKDEAYQRVEQYVSTEMTSYLNESGERIVWRLRRIVDVAPVLEDREGDVRTTRRSSRSSTRRSGSGFRRVSEPIAVPNLLRQAGRPLICSRDWLDAASAEVRSP